MMKVTAPSLIAFKKSRRKITALTCYDYLSAKLLNEAGVDVLLVGDSLGMVKLGYSSTLPVTIEDMVYHTRIVSRGNSRALLVADMPYLTYQISVEDAVRCAGRLVQEGGASAVKMEGGRDVIPAIRACLKAGIPVMGHLGLTPQSVNLYGGYKLQAKARAEQRRLMEDAKALERAGIFSLVLECIPSSLGKTVSKSLKIPTIGIGAGVGCDGQILVLDDVLGMTPEPLPRFVKRYAHLRDLISKAVRTYVNEVQKETFPDDTHVYPG